MFLNGKVKPLCDLTSDTADVHSVCCCCWLEIATGLYKSCSINPKRFYLGDPA